MTIAIGTDIIEIDRIGQTLARQGDRLVRRILVPSEREKFESFKNEPLKIAFLAKRWCAKEAPLPRPWVPVSPKGWVFRKLKLPMMI